MKWGGKGKQEERVNKKKRINRKKGKREKGYSAEAGRLSYAL